jgi:hypothetical protein
MKKTAEALEPGDRILFSSLELMTNDGRPLPLQAEVIRKVPVYPGTNVAILTTSGFLFPVGPGKEFEVVEGDYDPQVMQMAYAPEVGPAEVFEGKSLE